jgi:hypothetical protein
MKLPCSTIATLLTMASLADGHTLAVPFFADSAGLLQQGISSGTAGFIGLKNQTSSSIVIDIVYMYRDDNGDTVRQPPQKYTLQPNIGISWRPFSDDPAEGPGRAVPNVLPGGKPAGSAIISWRGGALDGKSLTGRYVQLSSDGSFAHVIRN